MSSYNLFKKYNTSTVQGWYHIVVLVMYTIVMFIYQIHVPCQDNCRRLQSRLLISLINVKWSHKSTKLVLSLFCCLIQTSQFNICTVLVAKSLLDALKIMIDQPQDCEIHISFFWSESHLMIHVLFNYLSELKNVNH